MTAPSSLPPRAEREMLALTVDQACAILDDDQEQPLYEIIAAADCALESDNRHEESAHALYSAIRPFLGAAQRRGAAKALADALQTNWEDYIENVTDDPEDQP